MSDDTLWKSVQELCQDIELRQEDESVMRIQRAAAYIVSHILDPDYAAIDIALEQEQLRTLISALFPSKAHLYDLLYAPRFARIWEQFRRSG